MKKMSWVMIVLGFCFLPCMTFAQDNSTLTPLSVSDSAQSIPAPDYRTATSYEPAGGVKTIEEVKSELAGESRPGEAQASQPQEKGVKGLWNKITKKGKAANQSAKSGTKNKTGAKTGVSADGKRKVNPKAKASVTPTKRSPAKKPAPKTKSAVSRLQDSKSVRDQMSGAGGKSGRGHHF